MQMTPMVYGMLAASAVLALLAFAMTRDGRSQLYYRTIAISGMFIAAFVVIWLQPQGGITGAGPIKITAEDCADRGGQMRVAGGGLFPASSVCLMPDGDVTPIHVSRKSQ